RKLAERSSKATKEIADLITNIQKGTKVALESMQVGTREVDFTQGRRRQNTRAENSKTPSNG
ncbi:hypothetical protein, partial [Thermincola ferriacetica]|uniref:hypothetical protein n=1 Tax=Thermincola ferriacetica TaxID=281456 RepID=UPI001364A434